MLYVGYIRSIFGYDGCLYRYRRADHRVIPYEADMYIGPINCYMRLCNYTKFVWFIVRRLSMDKKTT